MELSEELIPISSPIYEDEILENIHMPYHSDLIPGSFAFYHINQMVAKSQIIKALELGYNYLWCNKLKVSAKLTHTILKKPRIYKVILQLEDFFENFRIMHSFKDIKGVAPNQMCSPLLGRNSPNLEKRPETTWWDKEWLFTNLLVGERIMIWRNGGPLLITKFFALATDMK